VKLITNHIQTKPARISSQLYTTLFFSLLQIQLHQEILHHE